MSSTHVTTKAVAFSLLFPLLLAFPTLTPTGSPSLLPRADDECFATAFGITDFRSFDGSDTQPASVSFKAASDHFDGQVLCSRSGASGSTSPYFLPAVPCNRTGLPNIFFSYPEDRVLRVYQVTPCGTAGQYYLSYADGSLPLFCYSIFGGQTCMTPTGYVSLPVTQKQIVS